MRKFLFTADTALMTVSDPAGIRLAPENIVLVYGDDVLFAGHFVETIAGTVADMDLSSAGALRLTVRASRNDDDTENPALTWQYTYNDGHYAAGEDLSEGRVTWLVPLAGTDLEDAVDGAGEDGLDLWVEISATLGDDADNQTLAQFQVRVYDQIDSDSLGTPAPTSPTYLTATEVAAIAATKAPNEANRTDIGRDLADGDNLFVGTGLLAACSRVYTYIANKLVASFGLLTGAQKTTLTGGGDADTLHTHGGLASADHNHDAAYQPLDVVAAPAGATVVGTVYRRTATGWQAADPDDMACETCLLRIALGADASSGMAASGVVATGTWTGIPGAPVWLGDDGAITETTPDETTHAGRVARQVGWVETATSVRFDGRLQAIYYEGAAS